MSHMVSFESIETGSSHRARMLQQFDRLLAKRRQECLHRKQKYFAPNCDSLSSYSQSVRRYRKKLRSLWGWPLTETEPLVSADNARTQFLGRHHGARVYRVWIPALGGLQCYGLLLLPDSPPPYRYVISQHGGLGIPEITANFFGCENYHSMSLRLVEAGYAVFAPQLFLSWRETYGPSRDQLSIDRDLKQVGSSLAALHLHMLGQITDWILHRNDVRGKNLGFVGLSYGGFYALAFGAYDPRVAVVVSSCFLNDRFLYNAADWTWFDSGSKVADAEWGALICPRPLYVEIATEDELFQPEGGRLAAAQIRKYYQRLKITNRFQFHEFPGRHEFNPENNPMQFLIKHFPPQSS